MSMGFATNIWSSLVWRVGGGHISCLRGCCIAFLRSLHRCKLGHEQFKRITKYRALTIVDEAPNESCPEMK